MDNITVIDSVFLSCLIAVAAGSAVARKVSYWVLALSTALISAAWLFASSGWSAGAISHVWVIYIAAIWFATICVSCMNSHFQEEKYNLSQTLLRLKSAKQRYSDHLSWLSAQVQLLQQGHTSQLLVTDMLRSMSRTLAFADIFGIFAKTIRNNAHFESCRLVFVAVKSGAVEFLQRSVYPVSNSHELTDEVTAIIRARIPVTVPENSMYVVDQTGENIVVYFPLMDDVHPVLIYNKMDRNLFDEIQPLIAPFYLEMRKSYLFEMVRELSLKDALTGCYLRRYFMRCLEDELYRSKKKSGNFSVIMFDIDNFKHINDTYGHLYGDFILSQIGSIIRKTLRKNDVPSRYGGEEFVLLLPQTGHAGALRMSARLRDSINTHRFELSGVVLSVSVSAGVAAYPDDAQTVESLIDVADSRMYRAKKT